MHRRAAGLRGPVLAVRESGLLRSNNQTVLRQRRLDPLQDIVVLPVGVVLAVLHLATTADRTNVLHHPSDRLLHGDEFDGFLHSGQLLRHVRVGRHARPPSANRVRSRCSRSAQSVRPDSQSGEG